MGELKRLFRPELLNRIDDIVVFQKLSGENLTRSRTCWWTTCVSA